MSGDLLPRLKDNIHERLRVVETERGTVTESTGLILEWSREGRCGNGPFWLVCCQIVTLMIPHRVTSLLARADHGGKRGGRGWSRRDSNNGNGGVVSRLGLEPRALALKDRKNGF